MQILFHHKLLAGLALTIVAGLPVSAADLESALKTLRAVGPRASGNVQATQSWQEVAQADGERLVDVLATLDGANPLAANWIRTAADAIVERQLRGGGKLPIERLESFLKDTNHNPKARRLAYEWLVRVDPSTPNRLLGRMLDDPSLELRRDAVAARIEAGDALRDAKKTDPAKTVYRKTLTAARDLDQVRLLAERLRKLGERVDLQRHFGYLTDWHVIGPFDNTDEKGFEVVYPPEKQIDLKASYEGKNGQVRWIEYTAKDDLGTVDLNKPLGEEKSVVGYAVTRFVAPAEIEVQLRMMSFNAVKIWVNGKLVDQHNVYHSGAAMDQYVCRTTFRPGSNQIVVKACQNRIMEDWGRFWQFQLRVCDGTGTGILSADRDK